MALGAEFFRFMPVTTTESFITGGEIEGDSPMSDKDVVRLIRGDRDDFPIAHGYVPFRNYREWTKVAIVGRSIIKSNLDTSVDLSADVAFLWLPVESPLPKSIVSIALPTALLLSDFSLIEYRGAFVRYKKDLPHITWRQFPKFNTQIYHL